MYVCRSPLRHVELVADRGDRDGSEGVRVRSGVVRVGAGQRALPARHAAVVRRGRGRGALVHWREVRVV